MRSRSLRFISVHSGTFHMDAVQHPQIHLSRTSPLGAQFEGTTAQTAQADGKIQVQPTDFQTKLKYTNETCL